MTANVLIFLADHYDQSQDWTAVMSDLNWTFVSLYLVEMAVKLAAEGRRFFFSAWNWFDGIGYSAFCILNLSVDRIVWFVFFLDIPDSKSIM